MNTIQTADVRFLRRILIGLQDDWRWQPVLSRKLACWRCEGTLDEVSALLNVEMQLRVIYLNLGQLAVMAEIAYRRFSLPVAAELERAAKRSRAS